MFDKELIVAVVALMLLILIVVGVFFIGWQQIRPDADATRNLTELSQKLLRDYNNLSRQMSRMARHVRNVEAKLETVTFVARSFFQALVKREDFHVDELHPVAQEWIERETSNESNPLLEKKINTVKFKKLIASHFTVDEMKDIAFNLDIEVTGFNQKKTIFAQELVEAASNLGTLGDLLDEVKELRLRVNWAVYDDDEL